MSATLHLHDQPPPRLGPRETVADRILLLLANDQYDRGQGCSCANLLANVLDFVEDDEFSLILAGLVTRGEVVKCAARAGSGVVKYRLVGSVNTASSNAS